MNKEITSFIKDFKDVHSGEPWYGRPVYSLLEIVDPNKTLVRPKESSHSLLDLLYHMLTWSEFTLKRMRGERDMDLDYFEKMDWRPIDPSIHNWKDGIKALKTVHENILSLLAQKEDNFLNQKVDYRDYTFRFLLNGLLQHEIYHIGQITYLKKLLDIIPEE